MKNVFKAFPKTFIWIVLLSALVCSGCASTGGSNDPSKPKIVPLSNQSTIRLNARDIAQMMRQVGFTNEQILELGPTMRDSLLNSGAAQLEVNHKVEAIFAAKKDYIYVATRLRGSFVYDTVSGKILSSGQL